MCDNIKKFVLDMFGFEEGRLVERLIKAQKAQGDMNELRNHDYPFIRRSTDTEGNLRLIMYSPDAMKTKIKKWDIIVPLKQHMKHSKPFGQTLQSNIVVVNILSFVGCSSYVCTMLQVLSH